AVTWNVGTVAVGGSTSLGLTATVAAAATGSVSNRAWVGSTSTDPVTTNDSSTVATTLIQSADLSVTKTGPASATAGGDVTYTIVVRDTAGPSDASGVTVTDRLPTSLTYVSSTNGGSYVGGQRMVRWNLGTLAAGDSTVLAVTATVDAAATGSVSDTATVVSTSTDPVSANDSSGVTTPIIQSADLAVTKTGPATDTAGTQISYTIGVSHVGGTSNASGVTVTDTLPTSLTYVSSTGGTAGGTYDPTSRAVTWNVGTVAVGGSTSLGLTATVAAGSDLERGDGGGGWQHEPGADGNGGCGRNRLGEQPGVGRQHEHGPGDHERQLRGQHDAEPECGPFGGEERAGNGHGGQ
ncbi:MAG: DUF11 domain-containing protein, partial [Gemmatimonadota bacterium]